MSKMTAMPIYGKNPLKNLLQNQKVGDLGTWYVALGMKGLPKIVSMVRKYHNQKPQTTPWHREEEPLNHHETPGRQIKQSNLLSPPIKMIAILEWT